MFDLVSPYLKMRCVRRGEGTFRLYVSFGGRGWRGNPVVFVLLSRSQIKLNAIFIVSKIA